MEQFLASFDPLAQADDALGALVRERFLTIGTEGAPGVSEAFWALEAPLTLLGPKETLEGQQEGQGASRQNAAKAEAERAMPTAPRASKPRKKRKARKALPWTTQVAQAAPKVAAPQPAPERVVVMTSEDIDQASTRILSAARARMGLGENSQLPREVPKGMSPKDIDLAFARILGNARERMKR